jgi:hypothetical protein
LIDFLAVVPVHVVFDDVLVEGVLEPVGDGRETVTPEVDEGLPSARLPDSVIPSCMIISIHFRAIASSWYLIDSMTLELVPLAMTNFAPAGLPRLRCRRSGSPGHCVQLFDLGELAPGCASMYGTPPARSWLTASMRIRRSLITQFL